MLVVGLTATLVGDAFTGTSPGVKVVSYATVK